MVLYGELSVKLQVEKKNTREILWIHSLVKQSELILEPNYDNESIVTASAYMTEQPEELQL